MLNNLKDIIKIITLSESSAINLDSNELPALPDFQVQKNLDIKVEQDNYSPQNANSLLLIALLAVVISLIFLITVYVKLKKHLDFSLVSLIKNSYKKDKKSNGIFSAEKAENRDIVGLSGVGLDEEEKNEIVNLRLETPKSLTKCIKRFLEITKEK